MLMEFKQGLHRCVTPCQMLFGPFEPLQRNSNFKFKNLNFKIMAVRHHGSLRILIFKG